MSNFFGTETNPQVQPAECNWGSGDKSVNDLFFRMSNPDTGTATLLMGHIFFKQLAEAAGYVHRDIVEQELVEMKNELRAARDAIDNLSLVVGDTRTSLERLDSLESPLAEIRNTLGAFEVRLNNSTTERDSEQHDEEPRTGAGTVAEPDQSGNATEPSAATGAILAEREGPKPSDAEQRELAHAANADDAAKRVARAIADSGDKRASESTSKQDVAGVPSSRSGDKPGAKPSK